MKNGRSIYFGLDELSKKTGGDEMVRPITEVVVVGVIGMVGLVLLALVCTVCWIGGTG